MKKLVLLFLLFVAAKSYSQTGCGLSADDTLYDNTATLITYNSARLNAAVFNGDSGANIVLKYVRVGFTDTVTSTTAWPNALRNLTGLQASTQYVYYYAFSCPPTWIPQLGRYYFTTLGNSVQYVLERPTYFNYHKVDSNFKVPRTDTSYYRAPDTDGGDIVFKPGDRKFYGYNGNYWVWLGVDSAGIQGQLNQKVDSVTVYGDSLWYWIQGVSYGYILPTAQTYDATVDFSVHADPNTTGTTFSPNTPQLTTKIYVSTIDGSQWTWNPTLVSYVAYSPLAWTKFGNSGTSPTLNKIGTTDSVDLVIATKDIERFRINARGALGLGTGADYGTAGWLLSTNGANSAPTWVNHNLIFPTWQQTLDVTNGNILTQNNDIDTDGSTHWLRFGRNSPFGEFTFGTTDLIELTATSSYLKLQPDSLTLTTPGLIHLRDSSVYGGSATNGYVLTLVDDGDGEGTWKQPAVTPTNTVSLTNKRWTARVGSTTSSATPTINTDNVDIYKLTAQAANITSFTTNLSGTPVDGDILEIQITGTAARTITWGASFVSSTVTLPATTVSTNTLTVIFQYYTTSSYGNNKWVCVNYY